MMYDPDYIAELESELLGYDAEKQKQLAEAYYLQECQELAEWYEKLAERAENIEKSLGVQ